MLTVTNLESVSRSPELSMMVVGGRGRGKRGDDDEVHWFCRLHTDYLLTDYGTEHIELGNHFVTAWQTN